MSSAESQESSDSTHEISSNDTVWALNNMAYRSAEGVWQAEFITVVFSKEVTNRSVSAVAKMANLSELGTEEEARATILERLGPSLQSVLPNRVVTIKFDNQERYLLRSSPTKSHGISVDIRDLPHFDNENFIMSTALVPPGTNGLLEMKTFYARPEGWGVISDIDDTIKVTQSAALMGYIRETFAVKGTPIKGMPELYRYIQDLLPSFSPFFYLSSSPYNLYRFFFEFCQEFFPHGIVILRQLGCMDFQSFVSSLDSESQSFKIDQISKIHSWLPKRKMICIGDSTQLDPEIYGHMYRTYPGWIKLILIRKVASVNFIGTGDRRNDPGRFEEAFQGVEEGHWLLFETPEECLTILDQMVAPKKATKRKTSLKHKK